MCYRRAPEGRPDEAADVLFRIRASLNVGQAGVKRMSAVVDPVPSRTPVPRSGDQQNGPEASLDERPDCERGNSGETRNCKEQHDAAGDDEHGGLCGIPQRADCGREPFFQLRLQAVEPLARLGPFTCHLRSFSRPPGQPPILVPMEHASVDAERA